MNIGFQSNDVRNFNCYGANTNLLIRKKEVEECDATWLKKESKLITKK